MKLSKAQIAKNKAFIEKIKSLSIGVGAKPDSKHDYAACPVCAVEGQPLPPSGFYKLVAVGGVMEPPKPKPNDETSFSA